MRYLSPLAAGLAIAGLGIFGLGIAGCSEPGPRAGTAGTLDAAAEPAGQAVATAPAMTTAAARDAPVDTATGAAFTETYPGAEIEQATRGEADGTEGGLVVFTSGASAEEIIAYYRDRAEAAGLVPTMAMARGDTLAYGAAHPQSGATLSVVASPDGERTSVQLSWSGATTP